MIMNNTYYVYIVSVVQVVYTVRIRDLIIPVYVYVVYQIPQPLYRRQRQL